MAIYNPNTTNVGDGIQNPSSGGGGGLNPNLVSAWGMAEGSGLTLHDSSTGGTNTATINAGASVVWTLNSLKTGVTSPVWQASGFASATSTTLDNFDGTTPFSVSCWFNSAAATAQAIMGNVDALAGTFKGWEMGLHQTGAEATNPEMVSHQQLSLECYSGPLQRLNRRRTALFRRDL